MEPEKINYETAFVPTIEEGFVKEMHRLMFCRRIFPYIYIISQHSTDFSIDNGVFFDPHLFYIQKIGFAPSSVASSFSYTPVEEGATLVRFIDI